MRLRWLLSASCLLGLASVCSGRGFVDVWLREYANAEGRTADGACCSSGQSNASVSCPGVCASVVRVCVQAVNSRSGWESCPLGSALSHFLPDHLHPTEPFLRIPFNFSWPGSLRLLVRLSHRPPLGGAESVVLDSVLTLPSVHGGVGAAQHSHSEARSLPSATGSGNATLRLSYAVSISCARSWYGASCGRPCVGTNRTGKGHYECDSEGRRVCLPGWAATEDDPRCLSPKCSTPCRHGDCVAPDTCQCWEPLGWTGPTCGECRVLEGCRHGYCVGPNECRCHHGWGGLRCDKDLDVCRHKSPCENGATCIPHAVDDYTCRCPPGFAGKNCHQRVLGCSSEPCQNGGRCSGTEGGFACECPPSHTGLVCELPTKLFPDLAPPTTHCLYQGRRHLANSRWLTADCSECVCTSSGRANCSLAQCQARPCVSSDGGPAALCPAGHLCVPETAASACLKEPCPRRGGSCAPWSLVEAAGSSAELCRHQLDLGVAKDHCARLHLTLRHSAVPQGATVDALCGDLVRLLLARRLSLYAPVCRLASASSPSLVQVDLVPLRPEVRVTGLANVMAEYLGRGEYLPWELLRAVERVSVVDGARASRPALFSSPRPSVGPGSEGGGLVGRVLLYVMVPLCLLVLLVALLGVLCLVRARRRQAMLASTISRAKDFGKGSPVSSVFLSGSLDSLCFQRPPKELVAAESLENRRNLHQAKALNNAAPALPSGPAVGPPSSVSARLPPVPLQNLLREHQPYPLPKVANKTPFDAAPEPHKVFVVEQKLSVL